MKATMGIAAILAAVLAVQTARATDVFNMGGTRDPNTGAWTGVASLETVPVGDPGNAADTAAHSGNPSGQGAVSYAYNIGKYEVTAAQYCEFLNKVAATDTYGLYNTRMAGGWGCGITRTGNGTTGSPYAYTAGGSANYPVNCVSFWDACRFANWLQNGQPTGAQGPGTTETGTYTLNGYTGFDGRTVQRNAGSTWAVTSEDEWYKAAYYKGGSADAGYWLYPTRSDTTPGTDLRDASGNNANYDAVGPYTTMVGEFQNSTSAYGTFDQGGNLWEWNESIVRQDATYTSRGMRGGSGASSYGDLWSFSRACNVSPANETYDVGFRVTEVPEPATLALLALGSVAMRRRRG